MMLKLLLRAYAASYLAEQAEKVFTRSSNEALSALATEVEVGLVAALRDGDRQGAAEALGLLLSRIR
jgi:hypothetical protein